MLGQVNLETGMARTGSDARSWRESHSARLAVSPVRIRLADQNVFLAQALAHLPYAPFPFL